MPGPGGHWMEGQEVLWPWGGAGLDASLGEEKDWR